MSEHDGRRAALAVQELYRDVEPMVDGAGERLMPAIRVRQRRRRVGCAAVALTVAVLGDRARRRGGARPTG